MKKSRHLSIMEFFDLLQKEYFVAFLRHKIYPKHNKNYYRKVMDGKKEKINNIAQRNNIKSIFNDQDTYDRYLRELHYNNIPLFIYKDDSEKGRLAKQDLEYYYKTNRDFSVQIDEDKATYGKLIERCIDTQTATIKCKGESVSRKVIFKQIRRVI